MMPRTVDVSDLPALYQGADAASLKGQKRLLAALRMRLIGLAVAALGGMLSWKTTDIDIWGVVAALGFVGAVIGSGYLTRYRPDRAWYEGRAAAESAKTLRVALYGRRSALWSRGGHAGGC